MAVLHIRWLLGCCFVLAASGINGKRDETWDAGDPIERAVHTTPGYSGTTSSDRLGVIMSPGYPGNYPNNYHFRYDIYLGKVKSDVEFNFKIFDLEYCGDCSCDFILIENYKLAKPLKYCGAELPNGNGLVFLDNLDDYIWITFHSNSDQRRPGFYASYEVTKKAGNDSFLAGGSVCPPISCPYCDVGQTQEYDYSGVCAYCFCSSYRQTTTPDYPQTTLCPPVVCPTCPYGFQRHMDYYYKCTHCYCVHNPTTTVDGIWLQQTTTDNIPRFYLTSTRHPYATSNIPWYYQTSTRHQWQTNMWETSVYQQWQTTRRHWQTTTPYHWPTRPTTTRRHWQTTTPYHWPTRPSTTRRHWQTITPYHWPTRPTTTRRHWQTTTPYHWPTRPTTTRRHRQTTTPYHWPTRPTTTRRHWQTTTPYHWPTRPTTTSRHRQTTTPYHWPTRPTTTRRHWQTTTRFHWQTTTRRHWQSTTRSWQPQSMSSYEYGCGLSYFQNRTGVISSPGAPGHLYPSNIDCRYVIDLGGAPGSRKTVALTFEFFELETCTYCQCDALTISSEETDHRRMCESSKIRTAQTYYVHKSSDILKLHFTTDSSVAQSGFSVKYEVLSSEVNSTCADESCSSCDGPISLDYFGCCYCSRVPYSTNTISPYSTIQGYLPTSTSGSPKSLLLQMLNNIVQHARMVEQYAHSLENEANNARNLVAHSLG